MNQIKEHYNKYAKQRDALYEKNAYFHKDLKAYFKFSICPKSRILELGCSTGNLLAQLDAERGVGVDISPAVIDIAKKISSFRILLL